MSRKKPLLVLCFSALLIASCLFSCKSQDEDVFVVYNSPHWFVREWEPVEESPEIQRVKRILNTTTVTLTVEDAGLDTVIDMLTKKTGLHIEIDHDIDPRVPLTLRLRDIVFKNALQLIMDQTGYTYVFENDTVFITTHGSQVEKEYLENKKRDILPKAQEYFELAYEEGKSLFENRQYEKAKWHFAVLLHRISLFPYRAELNRDYEHLCKQAIFECDRQLRDNIDKE